MGDFKIRRADRQRSFNIASGVSHTFQITPAVAVMIELEDVHFHFDSAVLLPDFAGDANLVGQGGATTGLAVLAAVLGYARDNPDRKLLCAGHTDTSGPDAYNVELSQLRADGVVAALKGDKDAWVAVAKKKHQVEDYQRILNFIAWLWGWPCDCGSIDNDHGDATDKAVRSFQQMAKDELEIEMSIDGKVGDQTWGAFFEIYMRVLRDMMGVDASGLSDLQRGLQWLSKCSVGCGESFPAVDRGVQGLKSATNRRVELLFFQPDEEPKLACHPAANACEKARCDLYAAGAYVTQYLPVTPIVLTPVTLELELTEIQGLYRPGYRDPADIDAGTTKLAGYQLSYKSEDDLGRIYINHIPRTDPSVPWDSIWKKNTQYIELTVAVTARGGEGRLPAGLRAEWIWEDPDDPSNAAMEGFSAGQVDPNDSGLDPSRDNLGKRDFPKPDAGTGAKFEAIDGYALHDTDEHTADTPVVSGVSRIRLHVTNVGGDNFRVRVRIRNHQLAAPGAEDATGLMTMWKRIELEYRVMDGAHPLPVERIAEFYAPCFVQIDVTEPQSTPAIATLSPKQSNLSPTAAQYVKAPPTGVFANEGKPGWFLLVSALRAAADRTSETRTLLWKGTGKVEEFSFSDGTKGDRIIVDHVFADAVGRVDVLEGSNRQKFDVASVDSNWPTAGKSALYPYSLDYQSDFVPNDGAVGAPGQGGSYDRSKYYALRHVWALPERTWTPGGLGFGETVELEVFSAGSETAGISPANVKGGKRYFAGRTIVFTQHPRFMATGSFNEEFALTAIVHELGHAFGFPHKCGYNTWEDPPTTSCAMNYNITWLYAPGTRTVRRFFFGAEGRHMCARHLHGIRMVHLEDNPAMWKWP